MNKKTNKHGLSRDIGEDIKRQIRQECGFGCVCCGFAIASYEHIDPEFKNAKTHDPQKIAYLCEACHSRVTRKFWSKSKVKQARKSPWCIVNGKCHDAFEISTMTPEIWLGPNRVSNVPIILAVDDEVLLMIEPPECQNGPFRLSGRFYDKHGKLLFSISRNEWCGNPNNWDIECVGGKIIVRRAKRKIALQIRTIPPRGIMVEKAHMIHKGAEIYIDLYTLRVTSNNRSTLSMQGRIVEGTGKYGVLLQANTQNGTVIMGPGSYIVRSFDFIGVIKNR